MNQNMYQVLQSMQSYMHKQDQKIRNLQKKMKSMEQKITELQSRPPVHVERIGI